MVTSQTYFVNEGSYLAVFLFALLQHEVKHTGGGRGRRGRSRGRGGGRTGSGQSLKFENESFSHDDASWKKGATHNSHCNSELKVKNLDLNVGLDENGGSATWLERRVEGSPDWPLLGMNEMKIDPDQQQASANDEEDYDEESIDED